MRAIFLMIKPNRPLPRHSGTNTAQHKLKTAVRRIRTIACLTSRGQRPQRHHAAANADRGENHDPTGDTEKALSLP
jgi:hypothetical protein